MIGCCPEPEMSYCRVFESCIWKGTARAQRRKVVCDSLHGGVATRFNETVQEKGIGPVIVIAILVVFVRLFFVRPSDWLRADGQPIWRTEVNKKSRKAPETLCSRGVPAFLVSSQQALTRTEKKYRTDADR